MSKRMPDANPILLPVQQPWSGLEDVAAYAELCLNVTGLPHWHFAWDKTTRRMGCCKAARLRISLSIYFVQKFLQDNPEQVRRTLLHELAHALAWEFNHTTGHGETWHRFCAKLGIPDEMSRTAIGSFTPESKRRQPRYVLCHRETGEIYHYYTTTPRSAMAQINDMYICGRKRETLGKLLIRPFVPGQDKAP